MSGVPTPEETAVRVVRLLTQRRQTVAVAESLTGGLLAAALIGVPGASAVVRGGVVAYMSDLKTELLDVDPELLARVGAVDPDVAAQMAEGVARRLGADFGVATTGVAGPDPQDGRPVGTVWIAVSGPGPAGSRSGTVIERCFDPALGRNGIRTAAVAEALDQLVDDIGA